MFRNPHFRQFLLRLRASLLPATTLSTLASMLLVLPLAGTAGAGSITRLEANGHGHVLAAAKGGMREMRAGVSYYGPGRGHGGDMRHRPDAPSVIGNGGGALAVSGRHTGDRSANRDRHE